MSEFLKGIDVSVLAEVEALGGKFFLDGQEREFFDIAKEKGINSIRLRLWNDPYDADGHPYGGGTSDYATTLALARRGKAAGMNFCLDFHYSDFWADPGKQYPPKAWRDFDADQLESAVYDFTRSTMLHFISDGMTPDLVQVGNEVAHGLLWPLGMFSGLTGEGTQNMIRFLKAGCKAVRETAPDAKIILHFDNGGDNEHCHEWFQAAEEGGVDYDIMGLSYYPVFHGTFDKLEYNVNDLISNWGKDVVIAETSYGFCMKRPAGMSYQDEDYDCSPAEYQEKVIIPTSSSVDIDEPHFDNVPKKGRSGEEKDFMFAEEAVKVSGIQLTPEGQCEFLTRLFEVFDRMNGKMTGIYYWEPAWLPVAGSTWATKAGRNYVNDPGAGGNEWANQCLFDYNGNALPGWDIIRDYQPKN